MAQLFDVGIPAISKHIKNIFEEGELLENSVVSKMEITASDGKDYLTSLYSLDAIIAVGYRVSSIRATRFRQWATKILNEYIRKGFVLDDDRLKQGNAVFGKHSSKPRNRNIANTMFKAGFIDTWGRGFIKIREGFEGLVCPCPRSRISVAVYR